MKILMLAPYVYRSDVKKFADNKSGFGMMVNDIALNIAKEGQDVTVITNAFTAEMDVGYKIAKHSFWNFLFSVRIKGLFKYLRSQKVKIKPSSICARQIYYYMNTGFVKKYIKKNKPDIVHIHGMGILSSIYVDICQELDIPCCVTAHGLLENDATVSQFGKKSEIEFFAKLESEHVPVTVISSGIKRRLTESYYGLPSSNNVVVVNNATNVKQETVTDSNVRETLGIGEDAFVVLAVGSLLRQKGQIQILRAYSAMSEEMRKKTYLVFAGSIHNGYPVREEIEKLGIEDHVRLLGFVNHDELPKYYSSSNALALASLDEGFGISLIEGMVYGVPFVTYADLDAVVDVYTPESGVLCHERTDDALAGAITEVLTAKWDKEKIKENARRFSFEQMAVNYIDFYKSKVLK